MTFLHHSAIEHAAATLKVAMVPLVAAVTLDLSAVGWWSLFWGGAGGSSRWVALGERPLDGLKSVGVGMVAARALNEAVFLPLRNVFEMPIASEKAGTAMMVGVLAVMVIREISVPKTIRAVFDALKARVGL